MEKLGLCDQVFEFDKTTKNLIDQRVLNKTFDYVFCPHQSLTSHRLIQKTRSGHKLGYHKFWNSVFFSQPGSPAFGLAGSHQANATTGSCMETP